MQANSNYYRELGETMKLSRQSFDEEVAFEVASKGFSAEAVAKVKKAVDEKIAAREPLIKEHNDRALHFAKLATSIRDAIINLRVDLMVCNLRCRTPGAKPPKPPPPPPPPPPPTADTTLVPVPQCPECKDLATRLNDLLKQRKAARGTLDTIEATRGAVEREIKYREAELKKAQDSRVGNQAHPDEERIEDRLNFEREHLQENAKYREFWRVSSSGSTPRSRRCRPSSTNATRAASRRQRPAASSHQRRRRSSPVVRPRRAATSPRLTPSARPATRPRRCCAATKRSLRC